MLERLESREITDPAEFRGLQTRVLHQVGGFGLVSNPRNTTEWVGLVSNSKRNPPTRGDLDSEGVLERLGSRF